MPKVSIVIPIYNVELYLEKCIQSVINQTLHDIEIILVDDESPDNCPKMCDEFAKQDNRIKVIHRKNGGLGFARNSGLGIATGEYVAFLDSDDFVDLYTYEHLYGLLKEYKLDAIYYKFSRFAKEDDVKAGQRIDAIKKFEDDAIKGLMLDIIASEPAAKVDHKIHCSSCTAVYRLDIIKKNHVRFHSERELISEDLIFNLDFLKNAQCVAFNNGMHYHYRNNPISLTSAIRTDRIQKNYVLYEYIQEHVTFWNLGCCSGNERNARLFIGYSRSSITQFLNSKISFREKYKWLDEQLKMPIWTELYKSFKWHLLPIYPKLMFYACVKKQILLIILISYFKSKS